MSVKQDRASPRTPADLERKYDLGSMGARFAEIMGVALDAQTHSEAALNAIEQTNSIVAEISQKVDEISITVKDLDEETVAALSVRVNEISLSVEDLDENVNSAEFLIGVINGESTAKISADRLDIEGKTLNIKVDATNINGTLTIGQLPSTVAETSDIPTKTSELTNDSDYQTKTGVTNIVNGVVTTDFVNALGITAKYLDVDDLSALGATIGGWNLESGRFYGGWYEEFSSDVDGSDMRWEYDVTFNPRNLRFEQSIYVDNTHDDTWSVTYNGSGITWDFGKVWIEDSRQYIMTIISNGMTFGVYPDMATGTLRIASN